MFEVAGSRTVEVFFDNAKLFTSQLQGMKQIVQLCICDSNSLNSLCFGILSSSLMRIRISGCQKLKLETPFGEINYNGCCNMFLGFLCMRKYDSIDDISPELVPTERHTRIDSFRNLTMLSVPTGTGHLRIRNCENHEILILICCTLTTSLIFLELHKFPKIESFREEGLPSNLEFLWIRDCKKLVNHEWPNEVAFTKTLLSQKLTDRT